MLDGNFLIFLLRSNQFLIHSVQTRKRSFASYIFGNIIIIMSRQGCESPCCLPAHDCGAWFSLHSLTPIPSSDVLSSMISSKNPKRNVPSMPFLALLTRYLTVNSLLIAVVYTIVGYGIQSKPLIPQPFPSR